MTCPPGRRGASASVPATAAGASRTSCLTAPWPTRGPRARLAIEGYPVDNQGKKVDLTMAYVGTRKLFEDAVTKAADTSSVAGGFPRVLMRLELC